MPNLIEILIILVILIVLVLALNRLITALYPTPPNTNTPKFLAFFNVVALILICLWLLNSFGYLGAPMLGPGPRYH
jgi:hypothetical protein